MRKSIYRVTLLVVFGLTVLVAFYWLFFSEKTKGKETYALYTKYQYSDVSYDSAMSLLASSKNPQDSLAALAKAVFSGFDKITLGTSDYNNCSLFLELSKRQGSKIHIALGYYFKSIVDRDFSYADSVKAIAEELDDPIILYYYHHLKIQQGALKNSDSQLEWFKNQLVRLRSIEEKAPWATWYVARGRLGLAERFLDLDAEELCNDQIRGIDGTHLPRTMQQHLNVLKIRYFLKTKIADSVLVYLKMEKDYPYIGEYWSRYYRLLGKWKEAQSYAQDKLASFDKRLDYKGFLLLELGYSLMALEKYDSAIEVFRQSIPYSLRDDETFQVNRALYNIADALLKKKQFLQAARMADSVLVRVTGNDQVRTLQDALTLKMTCALAINDLPTYVKTSQLLEKNRPLIDSLSNFDRVAKLFLQDTYKAQKQSLNVIIKREASIKALSIAILFLATATIVILAVAYIKRRDILKKISELNEELRVINEQLDEKVRLRTIELEEKNLQLVNYAFINAHKVRGPVATMMGLVNLYKMQVLSPQEKDTLVSSFDKLTKDLDTVIREIQVVLKEDFQKQ